MASINMLEAAPAKDTADLDAQQDVSTHSFTDVCDASAAFHFSTTCASQKKAHLEVLRHVHRDQEEDAGEDYASLDASVTEKRIAPILKFPSFPEVPAAAASAADPFPTNQKSPRRLSRQQLLAKKEEEWAAQIRAVVTEICLVCVLLLGMTWMLHT